MSDGEVYRIRRHDDDLLIPAGGETVAATRYEPVGADGALPVVLMCTPYRKDDMITYGWHDSALEYVARRGYEVVVADLAGSGASTGFMETPFDTASEVEEVVEIIEWLADRPWTTGRVGMYGHSWGGQVQLRAASERPDALEAIVPLQPGIDMYGDGFYPGGVRETFHTAGDWVTWLHTMQALPPSRRDDDGRWAEVWQARLDELADATPYMFQFGEHEHKDDHWKAKDVPTDPVDVPMFKVAGYRDLHPQSNVELFLDADGPKRLLLGPWRHGAPHVGRESAVDFPSQIVEWFDYFLKDVENGALDHAPVEYWTERDGGGKIDRGVWRGRDGWPTVDDASESLTFAVADQGLVPADEFTSGGVAAGGVEASYEHDHTVGMESMDYVVHDPVDTNADDARSLCFETEPFDAPVEFTGLGRATIRVEADTPHPILAVRLVDVSPDGEASLVSYGFLRASHGVADESAGLYPHVVASPSPEPLEPGRTYDITVPVKPKSHLFEAGHRLRVAISAAMFPVAFPDARQGSFTVRSTPDAPSTLALPGTVHERDVRFDDAVTMDSPAESVSVESRFVEGSAENWTAGRERPADSAAFTKATAKEIDLPHGPDMTVAKDIEVSVEADDPRTAKLASEHEITLAYSHETVTATSTVHLTPDASTLRTVVDVDGDAVFDETWRRSG